MNTYCLLCARHGTHNQQGPYYCTLHLKNDKTETNFVPMPQS